MREDSAANLAEMKEKEEMSKDVVTKLGEMKEEVKNMIDDKLTSVEDRINSVEKYEAIEERVEKMEKQIKDNVAKAVKKLMERVKIYIDCLKKTKVIPENYTEEIKFQPSPFLPST